MDRTSLGCTTPLYEITKRMMERITYSSEFDKLSEMDISIPGGGLCAYYYVGVFMALDQLKNKVKIRRIFGTSSGAVGAVAFACNIKMDVWKSQYTFIKEQMSSGKYLSEAFETLFRKLLPSNAYLLCTDKVFIHARKLTWTGLESVIFSKYESNDHLLDCIAASCMIPYVSRPSFSHRIGNSYYIDGMRPKLLKLERATLCIKAPKYGIQAKYKCIDENIDAVVLKGHNDTRHFIQNGKSSRMILKHVNTLKKAKKKTNFRLSQSNKTVFGLILLYSFVKRGKIMDKLFIILLHKIHAMKNKSNKLWRLLYR